jgi:hypothetical protein
VSGRPEGGVTLDGKALDEAVAWIAERFPGSPEESVRRSVALVWRALDELLAKPFFGKLPDPAGFRLPAEAIARRVRDLSPAARFVEPAEVEVCLAALVAADALAICEPGDPEGATPRKRAPKLALRSAAKRGEEVKDRSCRLG